MTRRFEVGPALVILGGILLLVSLFLEWYGPVTAWEAFEVVDVLLTVLGLGAIAAAVGQLLPDIEYVERRWLPALLVAIVVLLAAEILSPPPVVSGEDLSVGAWIALAGALVALIGTVLSIGRVSLSVAVEGRDPRQRVAAVDHRQETTDTPAVVVPDENAGSPPAQSAAAGRKG
jgi:hypothetical protein